MPISSDPDFRSLGTPEAGLPDHMAIPVSIVFENFRNVFGDSWTIYIPTIYKQLKLMSTQQKSQDSNQIYDTILFLF